MHIYCSREIILPQNRRFLSEYPANARGLTCPSNVAKELTSTTMFKICDLLNENCSKTCTHDSCKHAAQQPKQRKGTRLTVRFRELRLLLVGALRRRLLELRATFALASEQTNSNVRDLAVAWKTGCTLRCNDMEICSMDARVLQRHFYMLFSISWKEEHSCTPSARPTYRSHLLLPKKRVAHWDAMTWRSVPRACTTMAFLQAVVRKFERRA